MSDRRYITFNMIQDFPARFYPIGAEMYDLNPPAQDAPMRVRVKGYYVYDPPAPPFLNRYLRFEPTYAIAVSTIPGAAMYFIPAEAAGDRLIRVPQREPVEALPWKYAMSHDGFWLNLDWNGNIYAFQGPPEDD